MTGCASIEPQICYSKIKENSLQTPLALERLRGLVLGGLNELGRLYEGLLGGDAGIRLLDEQSGSNSSFWGKAGIRLLDEQSGSNSSVFISKFGRFVSSWYRCLS